VSSVTDLLTALPFSNRIVLTPFREVPFVGAPTIVNPGRDERLESEKTAFCESSQTTGDFKKLGAVHPVAAPLESFLCGVGCPAAACAKHEKTTASEARRNNNIRPERVVGPGALIVLLVVHGCL
jgi:hypothetical protein